MLNVSKIDKIRKKADLKQPEFAEILGISTNTYQNWLKSRDFRATVLEKIAEKFNVKIGYLFDEIENNGSEGNIDTLNEPKSSYGLKNENKLLKEQIKDLRFTIEVLKKK